MQQQLEAQYPITQEPELSTISEKSKSLALQDSPKTIASEIVGKIKAKSQKPLAKSSDIARYLDSDIVEFDVERLFNSGRDLLGLQRWVIKSQYAEHVTKLRIFVKS
jgi:hypothetical protein